MLESYKTKLVLFDLDGTLIDTAPDFLISLNNVLAKHGKEKIGLAQIRPHISEGSSKMIKFFFQIDYDHKNFEMYKNEFLSEYKLNLIKNSKLFDGMDDVIKFLDNNSIMYGIVTNKFYGYSLDQNIISAVGCPYVNNASEIISFID